MCHIKNIYASTHCKHKRKDRRSRRGSQPPDGSPEQQRGESQDARRRQANRRNQRSATIKQVGCEVAFPVGAAHGVSPSAFPQGTSL